MEAIMKDEFQNMCNGPLIKGNTNEGECICMTCKSHLCQTCSPNHTCRKTSIESSNTFINAMYSDRGQDQGKCHKSPFVNRTSASSKRSVKMLGWNLNNTKMFMLRCVVHKDSCIEHYCLEHDCVCCYECINSMHDQCGIIPVNEVSTLLSVNRNGLQKYGDLKQLQSRIYESSQTIYNKIAHMEQSVDKSESHERKLRSQIRKTENVQMDRIRGLCRETEDTVNVTIQSFKCYIDNPKDIISFVAYMKNKHSLGKLNEELSVALAEMLIDTGEAENANSDKNTHEVRHIESKLDQLVNFFEEFIQSLKHSDHSRKESEMRETDEKKFQYTTEQCWGTTYPDIIEQGKYADSKQMSLINNKDMQSSKYEQNLQEDILQKEQRESLVLDLSKVTRNSTKSGYGKTHRMIRHVDTDMFLADQTNSDNPYFNEAHQREPSTSTNDESRDDDEVNHAQSIGNESETDAQENTYNETNGTPASSEQEHIFLLPELNKREKNASSIEMKEIIISRENTIVCDVTPDGSVLTSGRNSVKRPRSQEIVLSTNRIQTKTSNPPGIHSQSIQVQNRLKLDFIGEMCTHLPGDRLPCNINDIACMPDGKIVVSDFNNSSLKLFYNGCRNAYRLDMQFPPHSVVCVSNSLLMFSYGQAKNKLALASVTTVLKIRQKFTTEYACIALATNNSFVYVLCKIEPRTEIHILNTEGVVNMKIDLGVHILVPHSIIVDPLSEMVFISDCNGISGIDKSGRKMIRISDSPISGYTGVATDSCGNVFVCTEFPDGVYAKPRGKNYLKPLLLGQGVRKVRAVCFNEMNNSLMLTFSDSNYIRQYKIQSD